MKNLFLSLLLLTSTLAFGQASKENINFVEYKYTCSHCHRSYTNAYMAPGDTEHPKLKDFLSIQMVKASLEGREIRESRCNGSRTGKHTFIEAKQKIVGYVTFTFNDGKLSDMSDLKVASK
jgi:hypothetical protein